MNPNASLGTHNTHAPITNSATRRYLHPTGGRPKSINLIALGPTSSDFHAAMCAYDPIIPPADETWTVNKGFRATRADLVFIMDDLIGERRKSERYYNDIQGLNIPVMTSIIDADVKEQYSLANLHRFPIENVIDFYGFRFCINRDHIGPERGAALASDAGFGPFVVTEGVDLSELKDDKTYSQEEVRKAGKQVASYLKNSVPIMLAYAGFLGVRRINLFGADYDFPGQAIHEADKANAEYWCGLLFGLLGIEIRVSTRTTLMSTNQGRSIYGYGPRQPVL